MPVPIFLTSQPYLYTVYEVPGSRPSYLALFFICFFYSLILIMFYFVTAQQFLAAFALLFLSFHILFFTLQFSLFTVVITFTLGLL